MRSCLMKTSLGFQKETIAFNPPSLSFFNIIRGNYLLLYLCFRLLETLLYTDANVKQHQQITNSDSGHSSHTSNICLNMR